MLKQALYYLVMFTTAFRFIDMIMLLTKEQTNLPIAAIVMASIMTLYGIGIVFYRFISKIRLRHLACFYGVQSLLIVFNLAYTAFFNPLQVNLAETMLIGSFSELLINAGILYLIIRRVRYAILSVPVKETSVRV